MQIDNKYNEWLLLYIYENIDNLKVLNRNDFENNLATYEHACICNPNIEYSTYEKVDLILTEDRILRNVLLFKGKYISSFFRCVAKGNIARDRLSNYAISLYPSIFEKFNFHLNDIIKVQNQPENVKGYFFGLVRKCRALNEQDIETWMDIIDK